MPQQDQATCQARPIIKGNVPPTLKIYWIRLVDHHRYITTTILVIMIISIIIIIIAAMIVAAEKDFHLGSMNVIDHNIILLDEEHNDTRVNLTSIDVISFTNKNK
jgi:hypothetical protein